MTVAEPQPLRHPLDPEPVRSTKAGTVLALGIVAAVTGFFLGGLIPATIALLMARSARADMTEAKGYLTGVRMLRAGERLAWLGIVLAATALVIASVIGILHVATAQPKSDFAPGTR
jgi:(hydroxyamino)benzene mutase